VILNCLGRRRAPYSRLTIRHLLRGRKLSLVTSSEHVSDTCRLFERIRLGTQSRRKSFFRILQTIRNVILHHLCAYLKFESTSVDCSLIARYFLQPKELPVTSPATISVGTTRPVPFSSILLPPRNHKTLHGQVTVLPSHSLLVDFRESERKRGKKGDEVLVIDPAGIQVRILPSQSSID
jgi:hypothetical protein